MRWFDGPRPSTNRLLEPAVAESIKPSVAVVVTCFDDRATLREAVDSIRSDPAVPELVVVDDGSTELETLAVLDELEREGVQVLHQENRGQAAAVMTGLAATSAPYVMRFDADDVLEPGALTALAAALDARPEAVAAWGDVQTFGLTTFRIPGIRALDPWLVTYVNCITGSGNLIRRDLLVKAGGWQLEQGFEDWDLWLAFAEQGAAGVYVPRVVFRHRRDEGGRLAGWLDETERHYEVLRSRHERLFALRDANRMSSEAPRPLKLAVVAVEALPGLSRLTKIHLCELAARLFWSGSARLTARMVWQAVRLRVRSFLGARRS